MVLAPPFSEAWRESHFLPLTGAIFRKGKNVWVCGCVWPRLKKDKLDSYKQFELGSSRTLSDAYYGQCLLLKREPDTEDYNCAVAVLFVLLPRQVSKS